MTRGASSDPKSAFVNNIWPNLQEEYDDMRKRVKEFCEDALKHEGITCQVTSRIKAVDSIQKSLDRREKARGEQNQFKCLSDIFMEIHDLVGLRIVLEFPDDMKRTVSFIEESFREEKEPVIFRPDRQVEQLWTTWFGAYQTRNHRVSLKDGKSATLSRFRGVMFEIQVTTFAENLYNKLAHPLLYKGSSLTRQDEIVLDMAHGNALNYALSLMYFEDKLSKRASKIEGRDELVAATEEITRHGTRFRESLTKGASLDTSASTQGLLDTLKIPPERCNSVDDLTRWIKENITSVLPLNSGVGRS
jgi:ppGpp synthetase/RelA/SpoT-type nucleotidyltranferase